MAQLKEFLEAPNCCTLVRLLAPGAVYLSHVTLVVGWLKPTVWQARAVWLGSVNGGGETHMGVGQNFSHPGTAGVSLTFPFTRVPFWVPIFDPQPYEETRGWVARKHLQKRQLLLASSLRKLL